MRFYCCCLYVPAYCPVFALLKEKQSVINSQTDINISKQSLNNLYNLCKRFSVLKTLLLLLLPASTQTLTSPKINRLLFIRAVSSRVRISSSTSAVINQWASVRVLSWQYVSCVLSILPHGLWSQCQLSLCVSVRYCASSGPSWPRAWGSSTPVRGTVIWTSTGLYPA